MQEKSNEESYDNYNKLQMLEERLNINKELIKTGDVSIRKEIEQEEKHFTVPITREVLIIEKSSTNQDNQTIRIPLFEEEVEVIKHQIPLNDVSIYKNYFEEIQSFQENLKKEILHVETSGNAKVINKT